MLSTRVVCVLAALALAGCGGGGGGTPSVGPRLASPVLIEGAVQKGPFIVGSTVLINRLDSRGRSTPSTLVAEIEDSVGSFSFETTERGPVQIVATGYYFSELTGQISDGQLTLKALYEVSTDARQIAHVNILTHLINDRVLELISDGEPSLREAIAQAEDELVAALSDALVISDLNEFSELSLYDSATTQNNTLGNAYLLALSTGFYKYAKTKAQEFGTATDAELTLVLNRISDDLADDGRLQPGPFIGEFVTAIRSLSPETIAANLRSRSLVDYPQGLGVPDISVFLDLCAGAFDCPWSAGAPMPWFRRAKRPPCMRQGLRLRRRAPYTLSRLRSIEEWHRGRRIRPSRERMDDKATDAKGIDRTRCPYHRRQDLRRHGTGDPVSMAHSERALRLRSDHGPVVGQSRAPDVPGRLRKRGRQRFALCHRRNRRSR